MTRKKVIEEMTMVPIASFLALFLVRSAACRAVPVRLAAIAANKPAMAMSVESMP